MEKLNLEISLQNKVDRYVQFSMKNKELTIIDYGLGNLLSLKRAFEFLGAKVVITNEPKLIGKSSRVVLPGVGAFGTAMNFIKEHRPESIINRFKWLNGLMFFTISTICAPLMIFCLAYEEHFIDNFIKSLLKKDQKK